MSPNEGETRVWCWRLERVVDFGAAEARKTQFSRAISGELSPVPVRDNVMRE